jgi:hypothetical protein
MNKLILSFIALLIFINGNAQENTVNKGKEQPNHEQRIERRINKLNEITGGLSDAQKLRIKAILEEHDRQARADNQKFQGDKEKLKEARRKRRANADARLKEVLSAEQYEKVLAHRNEMRKKHQQKNPNRKSEISIRKSNDDDNDEIFD